MEISYVEKNNEITGTITDGTNSGSVSVTFSDKVKSEMESKHNINFNKEIKEILDSELKKEILGVD